MFGRALARALAWCLWRDLRLLILGAALAALLAGCASAAPERSLVVWVDVSRSVPPTVHAAWRREWLGLVERGAIHPGDRVRLLPLGARSHDAGAGITVDVPRLTLLGASWRRQKAAGAAARAALVAAFDSLVEQGPSPGTAIHAALATSVSLLAGDGSRIRAILVFTDGVETGPTAGEAAALVGLPPCVWLVGVGATVPPDGAARLQRAWWERLRRAGAAVPAHHVATVVLGVEACLDRQDA